ncbi:MAG: hypothetical protein ACLSFT_07940 [Ruminococcus callidus]
MKSNTSGKIFTQNGVTAKTIEQASLEKGGFTGGETLQGRGTAQYEGTSELVEGSGAIFSGIADFAAKSSVSLRLPAPFQGSPIYKALKITI